MASTYTINRIEAFQGLNDQQLSLIQKICEEKNFNYGDKIFTEGEQATHLWIVLEGEVDLRFEMPGRETSKEHTVTSIKVKDSDARAKTMGWSVFVPPFTLRLSAYCASNTCKAIRLKKEDLLGLFDQDPKMGYELMSYMVTVVGLRFHQLQGYVAKRIGKNLFSGW